MYDQSKRRVNEKKFGTWEKLIGGGRRYSYRIEGHNGWTARYVKEVEKYPEDKGHKKAKGENL